MEIEIQTKTNPPKTKFLKRVGKKIAREYLPLYILLGSSITPPPTKLYATESSLPLPQECRAHAVKFFAIRKALIYWGALS